MARRIFLISAGITMGVVSILLLMVFVAYVVGRDAREMMDEQTERIERAARDSMMLDYYVLDGCTYAIDPNGYYHNTLVHDTACRNPLHWEHVLSDTSFYEKLRKNEER